MYAIVEIAGKQYKVSKDTYVYTHKLDANEGDTLQLDQVLLVDKDGKVQIGVPTVSGASVTASVLSHHQDDKVIVFKKKRRKGYQKSNGHRQQLTKIKIESIQA